MTFERGAESGCCSMGSGCWSAITESEVSSSNEFLARNGLVDGKPTRMSRERDLTSPRQMPRLRQFVTPSALLAFLTRLVDLRRFA